MRFISFFMKPKSTWISWWLESAAVLGRHWFPDRFAVKMFVVTLLGIMVFLGIRSDAPYYLEMKVATDETVDLQVCYDSGAGFTDKNCQSISVTASKECQVEDFSIPVGRIKALRIQSKGKPLTLRICALSVRRSAKVWARKRQYYPFDLGALRPVRQITSLTREGDGVRIVAAGEDRAPVCEINLPKPLFVGVDWWRAAWRSLPAAFGWLLLWIALAEVNRWWRAGWLGRALARVRGGWGPSRQAVWLGPLLFLGVTLGLLGCFFLQAASTFYLEVPMQTTTGVTTRMLYLHDPGGEPLFTNAVILKAGTQMVPVRFEMHGKHASGIQFGPTLSEGEVFVGTPVLRCVADTFLHLDIHYRDFPLSVLEPVCGLQTFEVQGDRLHMICSDKKGSVCHFNAVPPIELGFKAAAFGRTFLPFAAVWTLLVALDLQFLGWRRAAGRWLAGAWTRASARLLASRPGPFALPPDWENRALIAVLALSAIVQFNAALHHGADGQDFGTHMWAVHEMLLHPDQFSADQVTDPLFFSWLISRVVLMIGNIHTPEVIGLLNALVNLGALLVFHRLARRFVLDPVLRVTLMTLVAFLPLRLIHTVVFAADALTLLPFFVLAWTLTEMTDAAATPAHRRWMALAGSVALAFGIGIKHTFMSAVVAVLLTMVQRARREPLRRRETAVLAFLVLLLPLVAVVLEQRTHKNFAGSLAISTHSETRMSYTDILLPKLADYHIILRAPPYNEPLDVHSRAAINGQPGAVPAYLTYGLLYDHRHSFAALNHLAIFTDPLNIFQYDPTDSYFGQRSPRNQRLMEVAVKTALPLSVLVVASMILLSALELVWGLYEPAHRRPDVETVWLLAIGWFSNIVVFLPFAPAAYLGGFWLPRLTMPALLVFVLLTFYVLERLLSERALRVASWVALGYVVCQSVLQVSFLWPWGLMHSPIPT